VVVVADQAAVVADQAAEAEVIDVLERKKKEVLFMK